VAAGDLYKPRQPWYALDGRIQTENESDRALMPTCADVLATTLRDAGVARMFGLPGGEMLDFLEAARKAGIDFILTRHEAVAAFMADAAGQITRRPGVCVSTLGPGAMNLTLGVANAFLDRSPMIAITASHAAAAAPFATHQNLDLNAVFQPFTKQTTTLTAKNTAATVRRLWRTAIEPRFGPVHISLPSDVARRQEEQTEDPASVDLSPPALPQPKSESIREMVDAIKACRRPIAILGLDLDPAIAHAVRRFIERLGAPAFVTPKAKGILPEDHPQYFGVCGGLAADAVVLQFFSRADLLIGVGFDPVESDKLWHHTMNLVSIAPVSIAAGDFRPRLEVTGDLERSLTTIAESGLGPFQWTGDECAGFLAELDRTLRPAAKPANGLSPFEVTRCLRDLLPPETIVTTDVGSIKLVVSQAWRATRPLTFLESNGLSAMGYSLPAAMAAKLEMPDRPVLCTVGDGGFSMVFADLETCVRHRIAVVTVVFNDSALSLIDVAQKRRGYPDYGVRYGPIDFAAAAAALGAWSRRVRTMEELQEGVKAARAHDGPAVIEVPIDPVEYVAHAKA
jgi:acetolactate synthase I/II/III large subunit